jgi:SPP1 family predicted phage head-tail adaptor
MAGDAPEVGKLRKRVQIQSYTTNVDPAWNEEQYDDAHWPPIANVAAAVEPISGRELVYAGQVAADATHLVTIRYYQGLSEKMRLLYTDDRTGVKRYFNISFAKDWEEAHVWHLCYCSESR